MTFIAKYRGVCDTCGEAINVGDEADFLQDEVVHVKCPESAQFDLARRAVCPRCQMEKPVSGECCE